MTNDQVGTDFSRLEEIKHAHPRTLKPHPENPRVGDVAAIAESLRKHGQYVPIVLQRSTGYIVKGNHTRLGALRLLELAKDPDEGIDRAQWESIAYVERDVDDDEARAIMLDDNRASELGGYDSQKLLGLLDRLPSLDRTIYDAAALESLRRSITPATPDEEPVALNDPDEIPDVPDPADVVTQDGDVWHLGPHRVICGSCREAPVLDRLLDGVPVNVAFTSPPYADRRKYDPTTDFRPIPPDEYVAWFADVADNVARHLAEDGSWFVNIKEQVDAGARNLYVRDLTVAHVRQWGWTWVDELIWYHGGTPGQFVGRFKNGYEPILHFARVPGSKVKHRPKQVLVPSAGAFSYSGKGAGTQTGNIDVPAHIERTEGLAWPSNVLELRHGRHVGDNHGTIGHAAAFPVRLPTWFLRAFSDEGDVVLDPFLGSGTTLIAAHQTKRVAYGVEISPAYVDTICRRWEQHTGITPRRQRPGSSDLETVTFLR